MRVVIIIPTYNEAENIIPLIRCIRRETVSVTHDLHILVVDDSSPDGTGLRVRDESKTDNRLHLLTGMKAGLGAAYVRGMQHAIDELQADVVFEMDADFSHKPSDVPRLLGVLLEGADFVIGSRYIPGGSIPKDWGLHRRLTSKFGNLLTRYIAGLRPIHDCTAGFRAIRATLLKRINLSDTRVQGYAFQVALLHEAAINDAVIREVPVDFVDRTRGVSKLGLRDIVEFVINVWWIRFRKSTTFIKFGIVGMSGIVVNLGMFTLLLMTGMNKYLASPIAIELSIIWNFILNNYWTFGARNTVHGVRIKGLKFNIVSLLSLVLSYSTFLLLSYLLPQVRPQIPQLIGVVPAMMTNYLLNSYWTFKEGSQTYG